MKKFLFTVGLLFCSVFQANAAGCFWVGGTATWDTVNTGGGGTGGIKWASGTGGVSACAGSGTGGSPGAGDTATFDAASGGGTVTVNATISITTLTFGTFTGTLDFNANNNNITVGTGGVSGSGAGARSFKMGTGTWTINSGSGANPWNFATTTSLTFDASTSSIVINNVSSGTTTKSFSGGALTYNNVTINNTGNGQTFQFSQANTFAALTLNGPCNFSMNGNQTVTTLVITGSSSSNIVGFTSTTIGTQRTIAVTNNMSFGWASLRDILFTTGTIAATNSFDLGNNGGVTITPPSSGSGRIIGG